MVHLRKISLAECTASTGRMIFELRIRKDVEASGCFLIFCMEGLWWDYKKKSLLLGQNLKPGFLEYEARVITT
jgi:hypothetical protein